eukprot:3774887-Amphidinium_carterae.1
MAVCCRATVVYATATGESTTMGAGITVGTGVSNSDNLGRAFVVHDSSGARVACATLASPAADILGHRVSVAARYGDVQTQELSGGERLHALRAAGFVPYAGYAGDYEVDGTVLIMTEGRWGHGLLACVAAALSCAASLHGESSSWCMRLQSPT